jgi:hypothetical protein
MRLASSASLLALAGCLYAGCSVINAPDDVAPDASSSGGSGATSSKGGDTSAAGDPSSGGDGANTGVGGDVGAGGDIGAGGAGSSVDPNPTTGLLVVGALDDADERQLAVLAGRTGAELAREDLPVAAIAYDEAPGRHLWFVFTASAFPAQQTGLADLEVRRFEDATAKWTVLGTATALPPPQPDQLVVLNDRLAYLSSKVVNGVPVSSLTLLDTSDPTDIQELTGRTAGDGESYVGLVGERGSEVNAEATGGRIHLMISQDCTADDCELLAQHIFVAGGLTDGTSVSVDRFVGQPRFVKAKVEDRLYVAARSTTPSDRLVIRSLLGSELTSPTVFALTGFVGDDVGGFDLVECADAGAVTDEDGSQLFAFNLTSGQQKVQALGHLGAPLYTELFAPSVITLDPDSAGGLRSFEVSKSGTTNVAINERSVWEPPADLRPFTGATRRAESHDCQ